MWFLAHHTRQRGSSLTGKRGLSASLHYKMAWAWPSAVYNPTVREPMRRLMLLSRHSHASGKVYVRFKARASKAVGDEWQGHASSKRLSVQEFWRMAFLLTTSFPGYWWGMWWVAARCSLGRTPGRCRRPPGMEESCEARLASHQAAIASPQPPLLLSAQGLSSPEEKCLKMLLALHTLFPHSARYSTVVSQIKNKNRTRKFRYF